MFEYDSFKYTLTYQFATYKQNVSVKKALKLEFDTGTFTETPRNKAGPNLRSLSY